MKPIDIEFLADPRKRFAWLVFALVAVVLVGITFWKVLEHRRSVERAITEASVLRAAEASRRREPAPKVDLKAQSKHAVAKLLQQDLGKMFAAVENIRLPDLRLKALSFDAASNIVRIEYELGTMTQVETVNNALNQGYDIQPWTLERADLDGAAGNRGVAEVSNTVRASWFARLDQL